MIYTDTKCFFLLFMGCFMIFPTSHSNFTPIHPPLSYTFLAIFSRSLGRVLAGIPTTRGKALSEGFGHVAEELSQLAEVVRQHFALTPFPYDQPHAMQGQRERFSSF